MREKWVILLKHAQHLDWSRIAKIIKSREFVLKVMEALLSKKKTDASFNYELLDPIKG